MRYLKFRVRNFKGIKDTEIDLRSLTGANVFSFVGLNESGKTTLLEAIHSFAPDYRSGRVVKSISNSSKDQAASRVPRHLIASFTGEIIVDAEVKISDLDRTDIDEYLRENYDLRISQDSLPDRFTMSRIDMFERGDFKSSGTRLDFLPQIKGKSQRKFRDSSPKELKIIWEALYECAPSIAYYPTFTFDFPERIYITSRSGVGDYFYKQVIEDILAVDGQGYTSEDLIRRIRSDKFRLPWSDFLPNWMVGEDKDKVQQIIDRASAAVTKSVFGKWNRIFGEEVRGKELTLNYNVEEGRKLTADKKSYISHDEHDIFVWFEIKDGTRRFKVSDRSLGFRWFFAFLLFTQFRVRTRSKPEGNGCGEAYG
jgi:hypothetical protein